MTPVELAVKSMSDHLIAFQEEFDQAFPNAATIFANQRAYNILSSIYGDLIKHRFDLEYLLRDGVGR